MTYFTRKEVADLIEATNTQNRLLLVCAVTGIVIATAPVLELAGLFVSWWRNR